MYTAFVICALVALWGLALASTRFIRKASLQEATEAYLYLAPAGGILLLFWFIPVGFSILISFTDWSIASSFSDVNWIGLSNYRKAMEDPDFWVVLSNTVNYVVYSVPLTLIGALGVAVLLNSKVKGQNVFRTLYFLPYVTTWVAISIVFKYVFNRDFGLMNYGLEQLGLPTYEWLDDSTGIVEILLRDVFGKTFDAPLHPLLAGPSLAMFTIILTSVWRDIGYFMVIFLAGLQNIDRTYYEAADIDGASAWQKFRTITLPLLSPTTFFTLVIAMIAAFKVFVPMYVMTPTGGPGRSTTTLVFYLYDQGFKGHQDLGYASALAYILFVIILILTILQNRFFGRRVHYY